MKGQNYKDVVVNTYHWEDMSVSNSFVVLLLNCGSLLAVYIRRMHSSLTILSLSLSLSLSMNCFYLHNFFFSPKHVVVPG